MRNFKKIVLAVITLVVFETALNFLLTPVSYGDFLDIDLKKMEKEGRKPELVFVGDSRIYRTFIPGIFEEGMEEIETAVNIGTGSQSIQGSYFYLMDIVKRYKPEYAVVGIDHIWFMNESEYITQGELTVIDRIKSPTIRIQSIINLLDKKDYLYLLGSYRSREDIVNAVQNVKDKLDADVRNGIDKRKGEYYADKGFVYTESGFKEGNVGLPDPPPMQWKDSEREEEAFVYLDKITALCEENNIRLFLVTGPTTLSTIYSIEDYEGAVSFFKEYALDKGIIYQDMNLIKDREMVLPDSAMYDCDHVNGKGAEIISRKYCEILKKNITGEDTTDYFYSTVKEMKQDIAKVVACGFRTEELESGDYKITAVGLCAPEQSAEFEFLISEDEGRTWKILREYGMENEYIIDRNRLLEEVTLRVNSRVQGSKAPFEAYKQNKKSIYLK